MQPHLHVRGNVLAFGRGDNFGHQFVKFVDAETSNNFRQSLGGTGTVHRRRLGCQSLHQPRKQVVERSFAHPANHSAQRAGGYTSHVRYGIQ